LLEDLNSEADATCVAERIHEELSMPFKLAGTEVFSSVSLGIAFSNLGYEKPDEMLRDADTAMYRAKANGRARHEVFDAAMHRKTLSLLQLETDLRRALERQELLLFYQPIVDLASRRLSGFEALARWQHPERGMVMPELFIPIAEETGLIGRIGLWVLREACRQTAEWQRKYERSPRLCISVNMSTRQLAQKDLAEQVARILGETNLLSTSLILEITESALIHNLRASATALKQLHDLPVKLHIDDFGTGYSSLKHLHGFPVDTLKIDRSFVAQMRGEDESAIVRAIVHLAHNLGMCVTAEGVETAEQLQALRALNCTRAQGFFFSPPLPAQDVERLIVDGLPEF
jgi:EAL domain-containing protein (putative c-di-GMP-specific phosphodiesterase class I)